GRGGAPGSDDDGPRSPGADAGADLTDRWFAVGRTWRRHRGSPGRGAGRHGVLTVDHVLGLDRGGRRRGAGPAVVPAVPVAPARGVRTAGRPRAGGRLPR